MGKVTLNPELTEKLRLATKTVELVDATGKLIGRFIPIGSPEHGRILAKEELDRREAADGGRP